jgi:hypothetical protein
MQTAFAPGGKLLRTDEAEREDLLLAAGIRGGDTGVLVT